MLRPGYPKTHTWRGAARTADDPCSPPSALPLTATQDQIGDRGTRRHATPPPANSRCGRERPLTCQATNGAIDIRA